MITKNKKLLAIVLTFFMIFGSMSLTACSLFGPSENDIEIISQGFGYSEFGSNAVVVKIKNKSSATMKVSFSVKIYRDGEIIDDTISGVSTLDSGEIATLSAVTKAKSTYGLQYDNRYSFKITKWNFY